MEHEPFKEPGHGCTSPEQRIRPRPNVEDMRRLLAGMYLGRHAPMAPHHRGALREWLDYPTDDELREMLGS